MASSAGGRNNADLAGEAQYLTLAGLLGSEPEPWGLAALITLARAPAPTHGFVPLEEQDTTLWNEQLITEGEQYLSLATTAGPPEVHDYLLRRAADIRAEPDRVSP
ncbi:DUF6596 domain-containing protein [Arthrobacter sp. HLT1-20]